MIRWVPRGQSGWNTYEQHKQGYLGTSILYQTYMISIPGPLCPNVGHPQQQVAVWRSLALQPSISLHSSHLVLLVEPAQRSVRIRGLRRARVLRQKARESEQDTEGQAA